MKKIEEVYSSVGQLQTKNNRGVSAQEIADFMDVGRANVSRYLNKLSKLGKLKKSDGRPVLFSIDSLQMDGEELTFDDLLKSSPSLKSSIQQAKAAILYPPNGLHTMITGETGVGKSLFAELMYKFAKTSGTIDLNAPFIHFNCADYSENPQLLISQIFGVKKGAYTGATESREGLLQKADRGFLFLDEVHRLSPQGQEMLFTYIDKGFFRKLGETNQKEKVNVRLVLATTEKLDGYLLDTFQRRIPMIIHLLPLRERPLKERYQLIHKFILSEAMQVKKNIYMEQNSLKSFLLYECKNNIGQLKSDIKLSSARAFLEYKSSDNDYIYISQTELPYHVKKGLMRIKENRNEISKLLKGTDDVLEFRYNATDRVANETDEEFYDVIEKKLETLKESGLSTQEINKIVNLDIDSYFHQYISDLSVNIKQHELSNIVTEEVIEISNRLLKYAEDRLEKKYDEKVYFGLALHLSSTIERLRNGETVYYPELNKVRTSYQREFLLSMELANMIDQAFDVRVPLDEVGYLTMFLASDILGEEQNDESKVKVIVMMHGDTTATSMVDVVKSLINAENIIGLNMPLHLKAQDFYEKVKTLVKTLESGEGLLFLVDMGSLVNFGKIMEEELGIYIKTIDDVSTPTVLAAARKADIGQSLDDIYQSISKNRLLHFNRKNLEEKEDIIISACFTGKGASDTIKNYLHENITQDIVIETLDIIDKTEFHQKLKKIKETHNIKAIISTVQLDIKEFPFFDAMDILTGDGMERLNKLIGATNYAVSPERIADHLSIPSPKKLLEEITDFIDTVEKVLEFRILNDVKTGIILHMTFLIDTLVQDETVDRVKEEIQDFITNNKDMIQQISRLILPLETKYEISISEDEKAYILKMFKKNSL